MGSTIRLPLSQPQRLQYYSSCAFGQHLLLIKKSRNSIALFYPQIHRFQTHCVYILFKHETLCVSRINEIIRVLPNTAGFDYFFSTFYL